MNREDIIERLRYTYTLPRGPRRSALVAEAVTWADEIGDEQLQVDTRTQLVADYAWGGEEWKGGGALRVVPGPAGRTARPVR